MTILMKGAHSPKQTHENIVLEAGTAQRLASNPDLSVWVNASAGSGKTKVLTDRILRLLLPHGPDMKGTPPERILALTYTKAGASEMIARLHRDLSVWASMDERDLSAHLDKNLFGRTPTQDELEAARQLFARVLDTPGGLKVMTIHSFCQSVLARFPLEAGISPNAIAMEEDEAKQLLDLAKKQVFKNIDPKGIGPINESVRLLGDAYPSPTELEKFLNECLSHRDVFEQQLKQYFGVDGIFTALCSSLNIAPHETDEAVVSAFCEKPARFECATALISVLQTNKKYHETINGLQIFKDTNINKRAALYDHYKNCFLTKDLTPRKAIKKSLEAYDSMHNTDISRLYDLEVQQLCALESKRVIIRQIHATRAFFHLVSSVLEHYEVLKHQQGRLDFDDMIIKTLNLLRGQNDVLKHYISDKASSQAWVLYKLDGGIDHLLIDEAQDTSPLQWEILKTIGEEFFAGLSANQNERTVFVVGDEKQSIFSFQGAQPDKFEDMRFWFQQKLKAVQKELQKVDLTVSFRSTIPILSLVDHVFYDRDNLGTSYLNHTAFRAEQAGHVELWPFIQTDKDRTEEIGDLLKKHSVPLKNTEESSYLMAKKIGDMIKNWIDQKEILEGYGRPIEPQDILILVRTRKTFARQMIRTLKRNGIPVSGADRMVLGDQIVIEDLCAAARFARLPDDDLTLACLLKSPWIGINEETLFDLCNKRTDSLWNQVQKNGDNIIVKWLEKLIEYGASETIYDFFSFLIYHPCPQNKTSGLAAIKTRLGDDALDPLDEFLSLSLAFSKKEPGSGLERFLQHLEQEDITIKRQLEEAKGAVRLMTIHGSKGLQAPIVFLPDTVFPMGGLRGDRIFWPTKDGQKEIPPLILPNKDDMPEILEPLVHEKNRLRQEEYNRLLYVAMTRAEERLYVGGFANRALSDTQRELSWYTLVENGFRRLSENKQIKIISTENGPHYQWTVVRTADADKKPAAASETPQTHVLCPDYIDEPLSKELGTYEILNPSVQDLSDLDKTKDPIVETTLHRLKRGTALHKLFQFLPDLPEDGRERAAKLFLDKTLRHTEADGEISQLIQNVLAILGHPSFTHIFGKGSIAEVPITGLIDEKTMISGQIDRILITDNEIFILDYKTNRSPPDNETEIPNAYRKQMAAYVRALKIAYPDKHVRAAILWTQGPKLMELTNLSSAQRSPASS